MKGRPCIVYAHGGGAISASADLYKMYLSHMASDCGVVVFNVDYRLAPESRSATENVCVSNLNPGAPQTYWIFMKQSNTSVHKQRSWEWTLPGRLLEYKN